MKWINVKDRLPEGNWGNKFPGCSEVVLVANSCSVSLAYYDREVGEWHVAYYTSVKEGTGEWIDKITHWMPLPKNPHNYISFEDLTKELEL